MNVLLLVRKYVGTSSALALGAGLIVAVVVWDIDLFERFADALKKIERIEIDEIALIVVFLLIGGIIDLLRIHRRRQLRVMKGREQLRTLQMTMRTVLDIVGNFLNNLMLYRMRAEGQGGLDQASLIEMEQLIQDTAQKLHRLSEVKVLNVKEIAEGLFVIDMDAQESQSI